MTGSGAACKNDFIVTFVVISECPSKDDPVPRSKTLRKFPQHRALLLLPEFNVHDVVPLAVKDTVPGGGTGMSVVAYDVPTPDPAVIDSLIREEK